MCECISMPSDSFSHEQGSPPLFLSIGSNSNTTKVINHYRDLVIKYDFTPSLNGKKLFNQSLGEVKGKMSWFEKSPNSPYTPSRLDMTKVDKENADYLLFPIQYFKRNHGFMNYKGIVKKYLRNSLTTEKSSSR